MHARPFAHFLRLCLPVVATACGDPPATSATDGGTTASTTASTGATTNASAESTTSGAPTSGLTGDGSSATSTAAASTGEPTSSGSTGASTGDTDGAPATFWHIEPPVGDGRTWLVSPAGERTFLLGVNTIMRDVSCDGIAGWITRLPPIRTARIEWARMGSGKSGDESVDKPYCFNAVGGFSDTNDFDGSGGDSYMIRPFDQGGAGAPYSVVLSVGPGGDDRALRDAAGVVLESGVAGVRIGDPFNPAFVADIEAMVAARVTPRRDDPNLQLWYMGNEIGVFDRGGKQPGVRDFRRWLWSACPAGSTVDAPLCAPHALAAFLRSRYADLPALNAAWGSAYAGADFATIVDVGPRPIPYVSDCNKTCREDLQIFVHDVLLRAWVDLLTTRVRAADPHHIVASPRLALGNSSAFRFWTPASQPTPDVWIEDGATPVPTDTAEIKYAPLDLLARDGDRGFDVVAFNVYDGGPTFEKPWFTDGTHKIQQASGLPVIISEFGIRAKIDGWSNKGGAPSFVPAGDATDDQIQRGAYYQSQLEQFYSFRHVIGANWHAWTDRYLAADPDHQIDMGLIHCDDPKHGFVAGERWPEIDDRVAAVNCDIMALIEAKTGL